MESIFSCFSSLYMSGNFLSEMEVIQKTPFSILQLTRGLAMIESLNTKAICLPVALSVSFAHLFILYLLICPLIVYFSEQSVSSLRKMKSLVVTIGFLEILSVCPDKCGTNRFPDIYSGWLGSMARKKNRPVFPNIFCFIHSNNFVESDLSHFYFFRKGIK